MGRGAFFSLFTGFFFFSALSGYSQDLGISAEDMRIEQRVDGGYHLFIRKKAGIGSVLLTETTRDPTMTFDNYAYRSAEWNSVNGDEIRLLDGVPIPRENRIYSLIDSSTENHPELGAAFHIYIPYILYYGYADTRHGEVYVVDGTYLNIRAFELPYADYRGRFQDNPFVFRVAQQPLAGPPEGNYMKDTVDSFTEITRSGGGDLIYSTGPDDLVDKIETVLAREKGKSVDLVICLDTTNSMKDDIDAVREKLIPMLEAIIRDFKDFQIGLVLYKDYHEEYLTRVIPFTRNFEAVRRNLNNIRVRGGRDIPEAVYEALYDGVTKFSWVSESRLIVLIGDAPPHPRARGRITREMVDNAVAERGVKVNAIILPI
ncbi:MAG: VWA domain-containing protein [Spirochaetaceae bacterium]|nr:VWA domain-containing protein [Spirochaetaceae bacterium]